MPRSASAVFEFVFRRPLVLLLAASLALAACSGDESLWARDVLSGDRPLIQSQSWRDTTHHNPEGGFRNIWTPVHEGSGLRAAGWMTSRPFVQPFRTKSTLASRPMDALQLQEDLRRPPQRFRMYWIGHSTVLLQLGERILLIDPVFSERVSPVSWAGPERQVPLPIQIADLPRVDAVLISHDHYDHLDRASIAALEAKFRPLYFVPLGVGARLHAMGATRVVDMDWWQYVDVYGLRIHNTPARHFSGRSLTDRNSTLWASWMIEDRAASERVYYGGDTGYSPHFAEIRARLGAPGLTLLPIGAFQPRWFMREVHVDPAEAVQAFLDLEGEELVGLHWGVFDLADEGMDEPPILARAAAGELGVPLERIHALDVGAKLEE
jgi:N-acyl-phosphatidylethanolamine-hydrolysing phospholipase D